MQQKKNKTDDDTIEKDKVIEEMSNNDSKEPATAAEESQIEKDANEKKLDTSTTSFMSSFSTPKWSNFRRVFSFTRSAPTSMLGSEKDEKNVSIDF